MIYKDIVRSFLLCVLLTIILVVLLRPGSAVLAPVLALQLLSFGIMMLSALMLGAVVRSRLSRFIVSGVLAHAILLRILWQINGGDFIPFVTGLYKTRDFWMIVAPFTMSHCVLIFRQAVHKRKKEGLLGIIIVVCTIGLSACEEKLAVNSSNIDSLVIRKWHCQDVVYHFDSIVIKDRRIIDTIYKEYIWNGKISGGDLVKYGSGYLMTAYRSNEPNDTLMTAHRHIHFRGKEINEIYLDAAIEPYLDRLFKQHFRDISYCHLKRLEQDSVEQQIIIE